MNLQNTGKKPKTGQIDTSHKKVSDVMVDIRCPTCKHLQLIPLDVIVNRVGNMLETYEKEHKGGSP